jgi:hypothetical protein
LGPKEGAFTHVVHACVCATHPRPFKTHTLYTRLGSAAPSESLLGSDPPKEAVGISPSN